MSRNYVVYQSRNRLTGTLTQTLDTKHKDSTLSSDGGRYVAKCVEHDVLIRFDEHYPAGRAIAHVDEWCKECKKMLAKGIKLANKKAMNPEVNSDGKVVIKENNIDGRMAMVNNAFDKRWRNGRNRDEKTERQRNVDQDGIYTGSNPVKTANNARKQTAKRTRKPSAVSSRIEPERE
jgi:hypothetical protein